MLGCNRSHRGGEPSGFHPRHAGSWLSGTSHRGDAQDAYICSRTGDTRRATDLHSDQTRRWGQAAPTVLAGAHDVNPHLAAGTKDVAASRAVYEPCQLHRSGWRLHSSPGEELLAWRTVASPATAPGSSGASSRGWSGTTASPSPPPMSSSPGNMPATQPQPRPASARTKRILRMEQLDDHAVKVVFQSPPPLVDRRRRPDTAQTSLRCIQRATCSRCPIQPEAGGDGTLQNRRVQARRCRPL